MKHKIFLMLLGIFLLIGLLQGVHAAAEVTLTHSAKDSSIESDDYNFNAVPFGTAAGNRVIIIGVRGTTNTGYGANAGGAVINVTIGGETAVKAVGAFHADSGSPTETAEIWWANVSSGTSGTINVGWNGTEARMGIGVWVSYGVGSVNDTATNTAGGTNLTATLDAPENGFMVSVWGANSGSSPTWGGLHKDYEDSLVGADLQSGASENFTATITNYPISAQAATFQNTILSAASFLSGGSTSAITINLTSPINNSVHSATGINFSAQYNVTSELNWTNSTIYIWNENGSIFNNTLTISITGTDNETNEFIDDFTLGSYFYGVYACNSNVTLVNCSYSDTNVSFTIGANLIASSYDTARYETERAAFQGNISLISGATLYDQGIYYNGSFHEGTKTLIAGDNYTINVAIDIPLLNDGQFSENKSFSWALIFEKEDGSFFYQNLTGGTQNITYINLTDCPSPGGFTNHSLNFTAWDETDINVQLQPYDFFGTMEYWLGSGDVQKNISISATNITAQQFCISPQDETFLSDSQIQYEKDDYVKRSYYLTNASLTNTTNSIKLVLLNETLSTSFIIDVIDENQIPVPDVYINIQRYYPGLGIFATTEMGLTDTQGSTIGHFEAETEDYKITIYNGTEVLFQSGVQKVFCRDTPCTLTFQIGSTPVTQWANFGNLTNLIWSLDYNSSSETWTYTYVDISGLSVTGRLDVYYQDPQDDKTSICDTSSSSTAATITCDITGYNGTIYAAAYISHNNQELLIYLDSVIKGTLKNIFGVEGLFLSILILLVLACAGLWNPAVGIILVVIGFVMLNFIGLAAFGAIAIWSVILIGLILLWLLKS